MEFAVLGGNGTYGTSSIPRYHSSAKPTSHFHKEYVVNHDPNVVIEPQFYHKEKAEFKAQFDDIIDVYPDDEPVNGLSEAEQEIIELGINIQLLNEQLKDHSTIRDAHDAQIVKEIKYDIYESKKRIQELQTKFSIPQSRVNELLGVNGKFGSFIDSIVAWFVDKKDKLVQWFSDHKSTLVNIGSVALGAILSALPFILLIIFRR